MTQRLSLAHRVRQPAHAQSAPPLLLLLHGFGSDERDLFGLAPELDERFLIVSARAPYRHPQFGYAWFAITFTPDGIEIEPRQAEASRQALVAFVAEATLAYGADPRRVYLAGFSQGAIMSAAVALSEPELVAGAVLMSGRIPNEVRPLLAPADLLAGKPFLVTHGTADPVLPIAYGRASRDLLAALPVELTYHEYPMGHEVSARSLADVRAWLAAQLDEE